MNRTRASVRDGVLRYGDGEQTLTLIVGSPAWADWLEQSGITAFRVDDGPAPFSVRRQAQRGRWYWYAYRRQAGRLRKHYLGRSRDLTPERLATASAKFAAAASPPARHERDARPEQSPARRPRHNLPVQLSSFLVRQAETAAVHRLLESSRLVTLTGAGGIGKTRLALHLAAEILRDRAASVWAVELAPVGEPALVPQAIARSAGVREVPGQPLLDTLAAGFSAGEALLVLDNCEHLIEACAQVAADLLGACPGVRLLATSREPLGVPGEVVWRVPALDLPEPPGPASSDDAPAAAVRLFVERAQAVRPEFTLSAGNAATVAAICRRLDGIPLAIELAASQVRLLTPNELAAQLEVLRLYGAARLAERGETDQACARHATWFMDEAEAAARAFHGPDQGYWLRWAEREHDNIGAALTWAVARGETKIATRLAAAVAWSWLIHQRWSEGLNWAQRILALPSTGPTRERGHLLIHATELTAFRGDLTSNRPAGDVEAARQ